MKALLVYSGGMDSTVMLHQYQKNIVLAINFQYGSKHNFAELNCARENCYKLGIPLMIQELEFGLFKSDLLKTGGEIPKGDYEADNMSKTIVPFRNGIMLSFAAGIAESNNCDTILIANHFGDHAIYPDCRAEFIKPMIKAIKNGTTNRVILSAPYTRHTKRQIALIGNRKEVDFAKTYSCYVGGAVHCGECATCVERKEALKGFDNTDYLT